MRQIGKLPTKSSAETLADTLLTEGIPTKVEQGPASAEGTEQWILWGLNEDQIDRSREIFNAYQSNPDDVRFTESRKTAKTLRKKEQAEKAQRDRRMFDGNRMWSRPRLRDIPVVTSCIAISVVLSFVTGFGSARLALLDQFYYRPQTTKDLRFGDMLADLPVRPADLEEDPTEAHDHEFQKFLEAHAFSKTIPRERPKNPDGAILRGQVWRLVTPIFLHLGGIHLLFNMMMLYNIGGVIEIRRGSWKVLGLILTIAVVSNMAQAHSSPNLFGGMSGVVYGLFVYLWLGRVVDPGIGIGVSQQQVVLMALWMFMGFSAPSMNMANMAHLAGAIAGGVLALAGAQVRSLRRGTSR